MKKIAAFAFLALAPFLNAQQRPVVFVDVTVVPMDKEQILQHQTVVVVDERITQVASTPSAERDVRLRASRLEPPRFLRRESGLYRPVEVPSFRSAARYSAQEDIEKLGPAPPPDYPLFNFTVEAS